MDMSKFTMPGRVRVINGSFLNPEASSLRFIINPCSLNGEWKSKVQESISTKWKNVKTDFKVWANTFNTFKAGSVQQVNVQSDTIILNLLCLDKLGKLDQKAFDLSLKESFKLVKDQKGSIHLPAALIEILGENFKSTSDFFVKSGLYVYVYEK